ncbi:MAG: hypothetical protein ACI9O6_000489 [Glaciecola sp.]|jgi:hypothetical protein
MMVKYLLLIEVQNFPKLLLGGHRLRGGDDGLRGGDDGLRGGDGGLHGGDGCEFLISEQLRR